MEVCFLSGASLALAQDELEGKTAKAVKQALEVRIGVARFRLRLFSEHGSEIPDDEVFACAPVKLQMVVLDFYPADAQRSQQVISASIYGKSFRRSAWQWAVALCCQEWPC